jgi:hypothetical protein
MSPNQYRHRPQARQEPRSENLVRNLSKVRTFLRRHLGLRATIAMKVRVHKEKMCCISRSKNRTLILLAQM